jgi:hypothetical protein
MAQRGALIITWGEGKAGVPPTKGLEVFGNALAFYDELEKEGRISGYRTYASTTRASGCLIIEGDAGTLAQLLTEEASQKQLALGEAVVNDLNIELCVGGSPDDVGAFYATGVQALTEAGLLE